MEENQEEKKEEIVEIEEKTEGSNDGIKISNDVEIDIKPSYIEYIKKDEAYRLSPRYKSDKEFWNEYIKNLKCKNKYEMPKDKKCRCGGICYADLLLRDKWSVENFVGPVQSHIPTGIQVQGCISSYGGSR